MCATALRMSLAALRLHHGRRSGNTDPELAAVAGATPVSACLARHQGGSACARHAPSPAGVAPGQGSRAGRPRAPLRGGGSPVRRPVPARRVRAFANGPVAEPRTAPTLGGAASATGNAEPGVGVPDPWDLGSLRFVRSGLDLFPGPKPAEIVGPALCRTGRALQNGLRPRVYDDAKGFPPIDSVFPAIVTRWNQILANGKMGRSCSPN